MCVRERECVCVRETVRVRERECVCVRETVRVREREFVCVCECVWVCVGARERERESLCVCVNVCVCVCVYEREREGEREAGKIRMIQVGIKNVDLCLLSVRQGPFFITRAKSYKTFLIVIYKF